MTFPSALCGFEYCKAVWETTLYFHLQEAFDYIGSDRMVHEMKQDNFPENQDKYNLQEINLSHISHFVEVNQLAYRDQGKVWIHTDPVTRAHVEPEVGCPVIGAVSRQLLQLLTIFFSFDKFVAGPDCKRTLISRLNSIDLIDLQVVSVMNLIFPSYVAVAHSCQFTHFYKP